MKLYFDQQQKKKCQYHIQNRKKREKIENLISYIYNLYVLF
jgi:hypothetical protein